MHQSLYRKYRPTNFDEVVDQKVIIQTLKNAIKNNTLSHAYLFAGPRGTGKTSIAKILAKIVNCENLNDYNPCNNCVNCTQYNNNQHLDVLEIDAASNNGVEEIRELKSKIDLAPTLGKYKIYIIDEVHMLSTGAFNALLKTLEEPPKHAIFILATTDPHKIPLTILSRCQRFDFKKLGQEQIVNRIKYVVKEENIKIEEQAINEIAYLSDGGMRDALSLLDQATAYSDNITVQDIHEINGTITNYELKELITNILNNNIEEIFKKIDQMNSDGKDFYKLTEEIIGFLRNILIYKNVPNYFEDNIEDYNIDLDINQIMNYIKVFNEALYDMKNTVNVKLIFELNIIKIMKKEKVKVTSFEKIREIRINNTLCNFNKKDYIDFKNEISSLNINDEYYDLIKKGTIKAYSDNYFIILYEDNSDIEKFNNNYKNLDKFFETNYNKLIRGVAVDESTWEQIKKEFNNKEKQYTYIEEE